MTRYPRERNDEIEWGFGGFLVCDGKPNCDILLRLSNKGTY